MRVIEKFIYPGLLLLNIPAYFEFADDLHRMGFSFLHLI